VAKWTYKAMYYVYVKPNPLYVVKLARERCGLGLALWSPEQFCSAGIIEGGDVPRNLHCHTTVTNSTLIMYQLW
jgi:hypothetical protein